MVLFMQTQSLKSQKVKAVIIGFMFEHGKIRYRAKTESNEIVDAFCLFDQLCVGDIVLGEYYGAFIDVVDVLSKDRTFLS